MIRALLVLIIVSALSAWMMALAASEPQTPEEIAAAREYEWNRALLEYREGGYIGLPILHPRLVLDAMQPYLDAPHDKQAEIAERLSRRSPDGMTVEFTHWQTRRSFAVYSPADGLVFSD